MRKRQHLPAKGTKNNISEEQLGEFSKRVELQGSKKVNDIISTSDQKIMSVLADLKAKITNRSSAATAPYKNERPDDVFEKQ